MGKRYRQAVVQVYDGTELVHAQQLFTEDGMSTRSGNQFFVKGLDRPLSLTLELSYTPASEEGD